MKKVFQYAIAAIAVTATLVGGVAASSLGVQAKNGNNGTLKIHEIGTPVSTPNDDPKVCAFNVEAFGLDAGQAGYLKFEVQGKDAPHGTAPAGKFAFGPTDTTGYAISADKFNNGGASTDVPNGHYKVTLYGKDTGGNIDLKDVKAKSKVFKVVCGVKGNVADTTVKDTPKTEGKVLDSQTAPVEPGKGAPVADKLATTTARTLEDTGVGLAVVIMIALGLTATALMVAQKRKKA